MFSMLTAGLVEMANIEAVTGVVSDAHFNTKVCQFPTLRRRQIALTLPVLVLVHSNSIRKRKYLPGSIQQKSGPM